MTGTDTTTGILTFLIADVRGYTSFTQAHGDEGAARLADKFAEIAREGVEAFGGEVTELRGDEALAVFTSPRAAVRAAIELQAIFRDETIVDPELPLTVGIGIDAGEAVPVQGGYRGGALNLAARLCSQAKAGEVFVSQGVALLTRAVEGVQLEPAGETEVKGLSAPVQVFRASADRPPISAPAAATPLPAALAAVTPIVGRDTELRRLRWFWRVGRRGPAVVAVVQGPPGIGKTRLAAELAATAAASGARCDYVSAVGGSIDLTATDGEASSPRLRIFDDLDAAGIEVLEQIGQHPDRAGLTVLVLDDEGASTEQLTAAHRLAGGDERIVRPRPLQYDEMLAIAGLYVGAAAGEIPADVLRDSGGVPRKLHERISSWAHANASRRLGALATAAATGRTDLRSVESDLAGTVIDMQLAREQATLFGLGPGRRVDVPDEPPYRGLASFDVEDNDLFFGRERLVAELISRLAGTNLLGVVGASGSGKSSAVRAGLIPALRAGVLPGSDGWHVAVLRPGEAPLRALDRAVWTSLPKASVDRLDGAEGLEAIRGVLGPDERLVVVVDQLEEAFTLCRDEAERAKFLATLATAAAADDNRIVVVLTIRADFYGRCAADATLADLLAANHVLVGPMTAEEYRRAIVQPALRSGVVVEPDLVDDLVSEVLGEPGALPLLSTTLVELWNDRQGRTLVRSAYLATGGVRGAVARLAEDVYAGFDEEQQTVARAVLLRLAGPGAGDAVVRRRVPLAEFDADRDEAVRGVLDTLAARRLVTVSDGTVEVAHEALLREWPRLQEWLEEDREGRRLRAHLATAAQEWSASQRDEGELYRGARLSAALDWTTTHTTELNEVERDFIAASRTVNEAELQRQQRQNRRLRGLLIATVGVLVLALVAGALALVQRSSAQRSAREALARELGAEAVSTPRIDQAMLLAREGVLLDDSTDTQSTLLATLLRSPRLESTFTEPIQYRPQQIALSPDGKLVAVRDNAGDVRFFDTATGQIEPTVLHEAGYTMAYAGNKFILMAFPSDFHPVAEVRVYNASSLHLEQTLPFSQLWKNTPTGQANIFLSDPQGNRLYFLYAQVDQDTGADRAAYVESWNLRTGSHTAPVQLPGVGMTAATMTRTGQIVAVTDDAVLHISPSMHVSDREPLHLGPGYGTLSPDGHTLAFGSGAADAPASNTFELVNLDTGDRTPAQGGHSAGILQLGFTPSGDIVVSTGDDGDVRLWDSRTGALIDTLHGHSGRVLGLTFSADSNTAYTAGLDGAIFAWDLGDKTRFGRTRAFAAVAAAPELDSPPALALAPDGRELAVRTSPGTIGLLAVDSLHTEASIDLGDADAQSVAWSRNGVLAIGHTDAGVELWRPGTDPTHLRDLDGIEGGSNVVAFSPDGTKVAAVTAIDPTATHPPSGEVGIWDVESGRLLGKQAVPAPGESIVWSPDGSSVAVGEADGGVAVFDPNGELQRHWTVVEGDDVTALAFLTDDRLLAGGWSGIVRQFDFASGTPVSRPVLTETSPVGAIAPAPGGSQFAVSAGASGATKIWEEASLTQFGTSFPSTDGQWGNVAYTPDGSQLVSVYGDGTVSVWPVSVDAWMNHACAVARRNFTPEEWDRFVPGHDYERTCPTYPAG